METNKNKLLSAKPPRKIRIIGGLFLIFLLMGNIVNFLMIFYVPETERQNYSFIPSIFLLIGTPLALIFIGLPCFLGYYPNWITYIIPRRVLEKFANDMKVFYFNTQKPQQTWPMKNIIFIFLVFIILAFSFGIFSGFSIH